MRKAYVIKYKYPINFGLLLKTTRNYLYMAINTTMVAGNSIAIVIVLYKYTFFIKVYGKLLLFLI